MSSGEEMHPTRKRKSASDAERVRRLNANLIERRRMQNINVGFSSLKKILPPMEKKQTKAAVLQQAVQHILRLQRAIVQVKSENSLLKEHLLENNSSRSAAKGVFGEVEGAPPSSKYRKLMPYPSDTRAYLAGGWPAVVTSENQGVDRRTAVTTEGHPAIGVGERGCSKSLERGRHRDALRRSEERTEISTRVEPAPPSNSLQCIVEAISIVESKESRKKA